MYNLVVLNMFSETYQINEIGILELFLQDVCKSCGISIVRNFRLLGVINNICITQKILAPSNGIAF